ncbi:MAG: RNA polymerase sigma factor [Kiritimatiellales bacterium]|nr:RNA polymerase sigma factor [Kiritimatiellales bacterium]
MERTDELLMEAYRSGDDAAFSDLVHRYKNLLFGYLMRMTQNREMAEDLFQETFLRVHEKAHTYRSGAKFKSWIFTIATHIAIDGLRRNTRRPVFQPLENDDPVAENGSDPAEQTAKLELQGIVKEAIESLPPKQRAALILSYYEGHTYPEIAEAMGCSLSSVKTHMSRALKKLATRLPAPEGGVL